MKITSVEPQKKSAGRRTNRFNIFLDGQFAFGADEDLVVDKRLVIGKEISPEELQFLIEEAELGKLMERMYALLGRRERSEKEIRDYLKRLSFKRKLKDQGEINNPISEALIEKLKKKGLLNDLEFAKAWVESRSKKKGINALKAELIQKGISRDIIVDVLVGGEEGQKVAAGKLLERKMRVWKNLPEAEFKQKALQFLMRRGFEYEIAKQVLEKILEKE